MKKRPLLSLAMLLAFVMNVQAQDPYLDSWITNDNGAGGWYHNVEEYTSASSNTIIDITPPGTVGGSVDVSFDIDENADPAPPPANVAPSQVTIGGVEGTGISRDGTTGVITATYDLTSLSDGLYDVVAIFTLPGDGTLEFTTTNGFNIGAGPATQRTASVAATDDTVFFDYNGTSYYSTLEEWPDSSNITKISYSDDYVYAWSKGIASYAFGPYIFDGNINDHAAVNHLWKIPRNPEEEFGSKSTMASGNMAVFVNGLPYYPPGDDMYYYQEGPNKLWQRNAGVMEALGFDCSGGHPAGDYYHYHRIPSQDVVHGVDTVCASWPSDGLFRLDDTKHSPLIGWGFDGFPIYGPYGYAEAENENSAIRLIKSSWVQRDYVDGKRISYYEGDVLVTVTDPSMYGPDVDATVDGTSYPIGAFFEDYVYEIGSGDLNEYNLRYCVTPEFPGGTYAYFATVYDNFEPAFPYIMGEELFGVTAEDNFSEGGGSLASTVEVNETVDVFFPSMVTNAISASSSNELELSVYPNPATNYATINVNSFLGNDVIIDVRDLSGISVNSEIIIDLNYSLHVLNLSELVTGAYTVTVTADDVSYSQNLMVK